MAGWQGADCSEPTCAVRCNLAATLCIMGCNPVHHELQPRVS